MEEVGVWEVLKEQVVSEIRREMSWTRPALVAMFSPGGLKWRRIRAGRDKAGVPSFFHFSYQLRTSTSARNTQFLYVPLLRPRWYKKQLLCTARSGNSCIVISNLSVTSSDCLIFCRIHILTIG